MKKIAILVLCLAAAGWLAWLAWFKPHPSEEEKKPDTEVPVQAGLVVRASLRGFITAYGVVEGEPPGERPAGSARLGAPVAGTIQAVFCAEGRRVEKNELLFQLDSRAADVAVEKARRGVDFTEKTFERQKKLLQADGTSQKQLLDAEQALMAARSELAAAQIQQGLLQLRSPLSGSVLRVNVRPGEVVDPAVVLAEITDLDRLVVSAGVPVAEAAGLKTGQAAEAEVGELCLTNASLAGLGAQVDARTGTVQARVALPAGSGFRPGQWATVRVVTMEHKNCLAVPAEGVVKDEDGATVVAVVQDGRAALKPVKVGLRDGGLVEIEGENLKEGMQVVTQGAYGLPKETKIRILGKEDGEEHKKPHLPDSKP